MTKIYNIQYNVGKAKYVINYHDGIKTHKDGSAFFDIDIQRNLKKHNSKIRELLELGYKSQ